MNVCNRSSCQTTAGCAFRGPRGEYCWIAGDIPNPPQRAVTPKLLEGYVAFFKDFANQPFEWMVVIVKQDRSGQPGVGEVADIGIGTKAECDAFAAKYLGPMPMPIYTAPSTH